MQFRNVLLKEGQDFVNDPERTCNIPRYQCQSLFSNLREAFTLINNQKEDGNVIKFMEVVDDVMTKAVSKPISEIVPEPNRMLACLYKEYSYVLIYPAKP